MSDTIYGKALSRFPDPHQNIMIAKLVFPHAFPSGYNQGNLR